MSLVVVVEGSGRQRVGGSERPGNVVINTLIVEGAMAAESRGASGKLVVY